MDDACILHDPAIPGWREAKFLRAGFVALLHNAELSLVWRKAGIRRWPWITEQMVRSSSQKQSQNSQRHARQQRASFHGFVLRTERSSLTLVRRLAKGGKARIRSTT